MGEDLPSRTPYLLTRVLARGGLLFHLPLSCSVRVTWP